MKGSTHALIGVSLAFGLMAVYPVQPEHRLTMIGAGLLGALLPDLDHSQSLLGRRFRIVSMPLGWVVRHRGATHTLLAALLVLAVGWYFLPPLIAIGLAMGYASHLASDMMTFTGLNVFWPIWGAKIYLLPRGFRVSTGGRVEALLAFIVALAVVWQVAVYAGML